MLCAHCSGTRGVLQTDTWQKVPHRQSESFHGHCILPQAWPRSGNTRQPCVSAYARAFSISLLGCRGRCAKSCSVRP